MKTNKKIIIVAAIVCVIVGWIGFYTFANNYHTPSDLSTIAKHGEDISIYVDFGISSAYPRFFVYDNQNDSLLTCSKCTHGSGGGSTISKPVFSNEIGSNCSSLGEYKLTANSRLNTINMPCIRLLGLSKTNSNIAQRGVVIHEAPFFADDISIGIPIPVTKCISQGCFGISTKTFNLLQDLMKQKRSIYLYAVYNHQ